MKNPVTRDMCGDLTIVDAYFLFDYKGSYPLSGTYDQLAECDISN